MRGLRRTGCCLALLFAIGCGSSKNGNKPTGSDAGGKNPLCTGSGKCVTFAQGAAEGDIASAVATVGAGDTIVFGPGTYAFTNQLALGAADGVSVVGSGAGQTILDFGGQKAGEDALFAQSVNDLRFEGFTVKNSPGNAVKTLSVHGLTLRSLTVTWDGAGTPNDTADGAYGLYPVQSTNVLIEKCTISGASDSGIYVGQSQNVVVRDNEAFENVSGIEIENTFFADVHDNRSHDNTAGILVFDLPGLTQEGGHSIRVYSNTVTHNDTPNFAAMGDIVKLVPAGTGFFVMANHDVEVFQNTFDANDTGAAGIISYAITQMTFMDPNYDQYPSRVYMHDNTYTGNGTKPDGLNQIGLVLSLGLSSYPGGHAPDVLYDGIVDPSAPPGPNPMTICVGEASTTSVCNAHFDMLDMATLDITKTIVCDASPYACTLPPLPAVTFPGLTP